ncbi:MAG: hypothetical protein OEW15_09590 [Nitrospirota bacterium]|nr:hypothetical protein [Nitrospirota bacterium]
MTKKKAYKSDYIFVTPSFLMGMGSVLNIAGNYFSISQAVTPEDADYRAIESDWGIVGRDILSATEQIENEQTRSQKSR